MHPPRLGMRVVTATVLLSSLACMRHIAARGDHLVAGEMQPLGSLVVRTLLGDSLVSDQGIPALRMNGDTEEPIAPAALDRRATRFDGLRPGRYVFTVRRVGFAPERWVIAIRANCRSVLEIQARPVFTCFDNCPPAPRPAQPAARFDACAAGA